MNREGVIVNEKLQNFTSNMNMTQYVFDNFLKCDLGMFGSVQKERNLVNLHKVFYSAASYNPTFPNHKNPETGKLSHCRFKSRQIFFNSFTLCP